MNSRTQETFRQGTRKEARVANFAGVSVESCEKIFTSRHRQIERILRYWNDRPKSWTRKENESFVSDEPVNAEFRVVEFTVEFLECNFNYEERESPFKWI